MSNLGTVCYHLILVVSPRTFFFPAALLLGAAFALSAQQAGQDSVESPAPQLASPASSSGAVTGPLTDAEKRYAKAEQEIHRQEHQRILGLAPNFNTSYIQDAEPLTPKQKFSLAAHSVLDPFTFVAAAFDAGLSQVENDFPGYGQGAHGYGKRFGASYLDTFNGTMIGNALFPTLLHQDPRYFRKGTGSFASRFFHAAISTVWCRNDNRKWGPNYSNVLGNLAAGGVANLYYPQSDRGGWLTLQRAAVVSGEGAIGSVFVEFWPDIVKRLSRKKDATAAP